MLHAALAWHPWLMHLRSLDGASVELRVAGYEFPDYQVHATDVSVAFLRALTLAPQLPTDADPRSWPAIGDANWLQVCGRITLADGRTWEFKDPCLTT